jgi:hypothetical protein
MQSELRLSGRLSVCLLANWGYFNIFSNKSQQKTQRKIRRRLPIFRDFLMDGWGNLGVKLAEQLRRGNILSPAMRLMKAKYGES